jgi:DNA polymerase-3 subunit epsilon
MTISFTTLDTETTGIDPNDGHRVIEVALLRYDMTGKLQEKFVERFDPQRAIDPKAQAVHKISYAELAGKPLFASMAADMKSFMERSDFIIAHNLPFDAKFMAAEFTGAGVILPDLPSVDTMQARWATFNGKSPNLGELCFALGVPYDPDSAHGAEYDVSVTAACFLEGLRRGFYTTPTLTK